MLIQQTAKKETFKPCERKAQVTPAGKEQEFNRTVENSGDIPVSGRVTNGYIIMMHHCEMKTRQLIQNELKIDSQRQQHALTKYP